MNQSYVNILLLQAKMLLQIALLASADKAADTWFEYLYSFSPWQTSTKPNDSYLEKARLQHDLAQAETVDEFDLLESSFISPKTADEVSAEDGWSIYNYLPGSSEPATADQAVQESESEGYASSMYSYLKGKIYSSDTEGLNDEAPKVTKLKKKLSTANIVGIVLVAVIILGAAIVLIYGKFKRSDASSSTHSAYYGKV